MLRNIFVPLLLACSSIYLAGCNVINPSEITPTYVHVDSFTVRSNPLNTNVGSLSHKITHVWAYFNNSPLGAFDLPATFPIRADAAGTLTLLAGIDFDGLRGYESIYPLYTSDTFRATPQPGVQLTHNPSVMYANNVKRPFYADFENGAGNSFQFLSGDTGIVTVTAPGSVFEGAGSGAIYISSMKDSAVVISAQSFAVAPNTDAFLEIDYKGTMSLTIGMTANETLNGKATYSEYLLALKPRNTWGKIYVGIKEFVSTHQAKSYNVLLGARKNSDAQTGEIFVDNAKVVSL